MPTLFLRGAVLVLAAMASLLLSVVGKVEILEGLMPGEEIVASANFLVDAESRLAATGGGMPGMQHGSHELPATGPEAGATGPAPDVPPEHDHD